MPEVPLILDIQAKDNASDAIRKVGASTRDLITGFSGLAVSAFSVYQSFDRYQDMAVSVSRANLAVKTSQNSLEDATRRYNTVLTNSKSTTDQIKAAQDDVALAQERVTVAVDRATMVQENQNEALASMAVMIVPTAITAVDSLSKIWKNFPDMTGMMTKLSSSIGNVGSSAKMAAIGVGAFVAGFTVGLAIFSALPDDFKAIGAALMILAGTLIAATAAYMIFTGVVTGGGATLLQAAAIAGVGIAMAGVAGLILASQNSVPKLAAGGIVTKPTYALIGESGPEAVIPLNQTNIGARTITFNIYETENPRATADAVLDAMRRTGTA